MNILRGVTSRLGRLAETVMALLLIGAAALIVVGVLIPSIYTNWETVASTTVNIFQAGVALVETAGGQIRIFVKTLF